jgi:cell division protein FtsW
MRLSRTNTTTVGRWWWTIDRYTLLALAVLIGIGAVLVTAASPSVAERIDLERFYFVKRQIVFLVLSCVVMFGISLLTEVQVRRLAILGFLGSMFLMLVLPVVGYEVKGATRWVYIAGMSVQPSEFMKPCMAVVMAWIFSEGLKSPGFPSYRIAVALYAAIVLLLLIQPDFGMAITVSVVWGVQFFLAGLPFIFVIALIVLGVVGVFGAYNFFPHVQARIDRFLDPSSGDNYQVAKSLEAFQNGGILGQGPGEGIVKLHLPDSHTDFVFAVAGEEFGMILCMIIVALFAFIVLRGFARVSKGRDMFVVLAVVGLLTQFGIQAVINMGVAVNMLPAKGMTLPFLSYGGSSLMAIALGMGMVLALTRLRYGYRNDKMETERTLV